jgi:hypothetical protein
MTLFASFCLCPFAVQPAEADAITPPGLTFYDEAGSPMTLQESVDAAGDSVYLLFDLGTGQEWTAPVDAVVPENMLATVLSLGGDSALTNALFQPGAVFADFSAAQQNPLTSVAEPATLILPGLALLLLMLQRNRARSDGPL